MDVRAETQCTVEGQHNIKEGGNFIKVVIFKTYFQTKLEFIKE
jgi:hypothetical protein